LKYQRHLYIYTQPKSTLNRLQFRRRQYGFIFIRLAAVGSQNREIPQNSDKIGPGSYRGRGVVDCHPLTNFHGFYYISQQNHYIHNKPVLAVSIYHFCFSKNRVLVCF